MKINEDITINDSIVTLKDVSTIMMQGIYRGSLALLTMPHSGQTAVTNSLLETRYVFINILEGKYPVLPGFTRKYVLSMDVNTAQGNYCLYIGYRLLAEFSVWGANDVNSSCPQLFDVTGTISALAAGHQDVTITTAGWWYINRADILIYDIPN